MCKNIRYWSLDALLGQYTLLLILRRLGYDQTLRVYMKNIGIQCSWLRIGKRMHRLQECKETG